MTPFGQRVTTCSDRSAFIVGEPNSTLLVRVANFCAAKLGWLFPCRHNHQSRSREERRIAIIFLIPSVELTVYTGRLRSNLLLIGAQYCGANLEIVRLHAYPHNIPTWRPVVFGLLNLARIVGSLPALRRGRLIPRIRLIATHDERRESSRGGSNSCLVVGSHGLSH